ncbi:hypothetical protein SynBIOSE41_01142 [Synechococcus sp. BIOS-E4-1]|uniref:hypothetical protein n=1 Tax=Synechococcus sp. BIOS-E4-1 TaxID=1400864 RepID=UPI0016476264|nr:hypothetical protein [Synechococcus sp. BIOS-E4-1]QNI53663.1 hypothetical protein SynBIOSE41_01142 [Synechococcus sp. BIOS-E4-1]
MKAAPSCPLHLGILDSPDYWTDNALVDAVSPASASEWRQWTLESKSAGMNGNQDGHGGSRG